MTGAIFISDDLVQGLNLLKPIKAFSRVMSLSFGTISICICTITSSNIQTNEICLLCISSITLCNPCICTIASFHFVLLQVLYLYYWKFCSCPIANSVFVLLKFYLLVLLQIWYLYNCKFCICTIVSSLGLLLQVLYLSYCKFCICIIGSTKYWIWIPEEELQLHHWFNYSPNLWERQDAFQLSRFYVCIVSKYLSCWIWVNRSFKLCKYL